MHYDLSFFSQDFHDLAYHDLLGPSGVRFHRACHILLRGKLFHFAGIQASERISYPPFVEDSGLRHLS